MSSIVVDSGHLRWPLLLVLWIVVAAAGVVGRSQSAAISDDGQVFTQSFEIGQGQILRLPCTKLDELKYNQRKGDQLQWLKDGRPLQEQPDRITIRKRRVDFAFAKLEDAGTYQTYLNQKLICRFDVDVVNYEELQARTTHIEPQSEGRDPPRMLIDHEEMHLQQLVSPSGRSVRFYCLYNATGNTSVSWFRRGLPFHRDDRYERSQMGVDGHGHFLYLENLVPSDSGSYHCSVRNLRTNAVTNYTYTLDVNHFLAHPPIIDSGLTDVEVTEHGVAVLNCSFRSDLVPKATWYRLDNETNSSSNGSKQVLTTNDNAAHDGFDSLILRIDNVSRADAGRYQCQVSNHFGVTERIVTVKVDPQLTAIHTYNPLIHFNGFMLIVALLLLIVFVTYCIYITGRFQYRLALEKKEEIEMAIKALQEEEERHQSQKPKTFVIKKMVKIEPIDPDNKMMVSVKFSNDESGIEMAASLTEGEGVDSYLTEYVIPVDPAWELPRENLLLQEPLGEGAFGLVVKGYLRDEAAQQRSVVAVKMLKEGYTESEFADLISELETMKRIGHHPNIINLVGCCTQTGPVHVVVEYAPHGNLRDYLRKHRHASGYEKPIGSAPETEGSLDTLDLVQFVYQIACGMEYLASRRCIHRDLAARNVLVAENRVVKIADFGLARSIQNQEYYRKRTEGRLPVKWMSPESLFECVYTSQSDVWSFGITAWEVMTLGASPYPEIQMQTISKLFEIIQKGERMKCPQGCPKPIYLLMLRTWNQDPDARPTFSDIVLELSQMLSLVTAENYSNMHIILNSFVPSMPSSPEPHYSGAPMMIRASTPINGLRRTFEQPEYMAMRYQNY